MILYAWGANTHGQLGLGYASVQEIERQQVDLSDTPFEADDIVGIAGGGMHTLVLDQDGDVFSCGSNIKGQLGMTQDSLRFTQIDVLRDFKIENISCGWDFSIAISDAEKLFGWGSNIHRQLGFSRSITSTSIPSRLQISRNLATGFKLASCGVRHSAIITNDDAVLIAGTGSKGQLALGDSYSVSGYLSISRIPGLDDIISVACGEDHTVALKKDGTVFCWGDNKYGQLGVDTNLSSIYVPIVVLRDNSILEVYAGWTHSAALTTTGEVYTWGRNDHGQLGAPRSSPFRPEKISNLKNVTSLSLGAQHSLAVTKDGGLLVWGCNEFDSCGTGDKEDVKEPTQILTNRKVKLAFACCNSSFVLTM